MLVQELSSGNVATRGGMPTFFAWLFGVLTAIQTVWIAMEWWANRSRQGHLRGIRDQLRILREQCDAKARGASGDVERERLEAISSALRGIESSVGAAMGGRHTAK